MKRTAPLWKIAPWTLLLTGAVVGVWSGEAAAQETWTVLPFTVRGVESNDAETYRDLLKIELSSRNKASFVEAQSETRCADVPCAQAAGREVNAAVALYGGLSTLGRKIIVTTTVVDVGTGNVLSSQKMVVDRAEDLDSVASRMAAAILGGTNTDDTAQLGNITKQESRPDQRREGESGLGLRIAGIVPFGAGSADAKPGIGFDFSYWYEARNFAIEPRLGLRFDTGDGPGSYFEMPIDVGAYYILGDGDFTPFFGGGAGARFISETLAVENTTGSVIEVTNSTEINESGWGFGAFARAGLLLFRTYTLRVAVTADYNITFLELNDKNNPQSLTFGIGVMF